jgi:hypothetical protein
MLPSQHQRMGQAAPSSPVRATVAQASNTQTLPTQRPDAGNADAMLWKRSAPVRVSTLERAGGVESLKPCFLT